MDTNLILKSNRVVTADGTRPAAISVRAGKIAAVFDPRDATGDVIDYGNLVIMPGLVDPHVHINEPGRTDWEGFATATRAAAAGGTTTVVDMPLNSVPATIDVAAFQQKIDASRGKCFVDVGFWGGLVPGNVVHLQPLAEAGVLGYKCFMVPSGVSEFAYVTPEDIADALPTLHAIDRPLLVHAELPGPIDEAVSAQNPNADPMRYDTYLETRPALAECLAIESLVAINMRTPLRIRLHIVHLATSDAVPVLNHARRKYGLPLTVETCPHYLYFSADQVPYGATEYKCAPPIRDGSNRHALWSALEQGLIDFIASDHSPCPPELKRGDFMNAWGGIASVQLRLAVVWAGARERGATFAQLTDWLATAPAEMAGVSHAKGTIGTGYDADFVVWDPDAEFTVTPEVLLHRHKVTPYMGATLPGVVRATYLRGELIYDGTHVRAQPTGTLLLRQM